jgi:hypothetical protein
MIDHACGLHAAPCVDGRYSYCGPTALAAITGLSVAAIEDAILEYRKEHKPPHGNRRATGNARVKTVWANEIEPVCQALGYSAQQVFNSFDHGRVTLARYLRHIPPGLKDKPRLVLITAHFLAVCGAHYVDNGSREPKPLALPYRRCRVRCVWNVTPNHGASK